MSSLAVSNTFAGGANIIAADHNTNYADIVTYVNNRNSGSAAWDAIYVANSSTVPVVIDNSVGTQDIVNFRDNGTNVFQLFNGGILTLASQSAARAYRNTSTQSLSGATKVQFNAESYDVQSEFDSATNYRFTATKAGKYLVLATVKIASPASTPIIYVYVNGASFAFSYSLDTTSNVSHSISQVLSLSASDYVEIYVNAGGSGTITNGADTSYVAIHKIA